MRVCCSNRSNVGELTGPLFAGVPCLLLAAGPTLDEIAEDLPLWRETVPHRGGGHRRRICCARLQE